MTGDPEAEAIQRERERRRNLERVRFERERELRKEEVSRLLSGDAARGDRPEAPRPIVRSGPNPPSSATRPAVERGAERPIGGPIRHPGAEPFLALNPAERFDLLEVNALSLAGVTERAAGDPELLAALRRRAAELIARVRQETDDPLSAGTFLRERVLEWYRESATDPGWSERATARWSGVFAESRGSGGRVHPWLVARLGQFREEATRAGSVPTRLRHSLLRDRKGPASSARTAHQQIVGEVAQAILDDLAVRPREAGSPAPLVRLSELAVRRQVPTINDALALLFGSPESGPFVVLHPNRYPDCEELSIRPPAAGATGAALAYRLAPGSSGRKGGGRGRGSDSETAPESDVSELDGEEGGIWEASDVGPAAWVATAEARRKERRRLDPPPRDYRSRAAYEPLRTLLVENAEFRKGFLAVRWRGRPAGPPLLATLLQRGKLAPEVATDHEYLDAELDALGEENAGAAREPGSWSFSGWTVRREGSHADGYRYTAERAPS